MVPQLAFVMVLAGVVGREFVVKENLRVNPKVAYAPFKRETTETLVECLLICCKHKCCVSAVHDDNECSLYDVSFARQLKPKTGASFLLNSWQKGESAM
jgi:hypothetical protein